MARAFEPDPQRAALWDWAFLENPCTDKLYYLVVDTGDRLAAQYAAVPVAMQHEGRSIRGLLSMFTATDPDFQRQGLFRSLAKRLYEDAADTCPLVFGFPNEQSAPSFYKHLGWVDLRPYPQLRRPLRNAGRHDDGSWRNALIGRALEWADRIGTGPSVETEEVESFAGIATPIWDAIRGAAGTAVVRDDAFLEWRFVRSPMRYRRFVVRRDRRAVGLAVLAPGDRNGDGRARLMELMVDPAEPIGVTRGLVAHVVREASRAGAYGLSLVVTPRHPQYRTLISCGLLPSLRRSPVASPIEEPVSSFGVRVNSSSVSASRVLHVEDWYLSSAEQDWI
jgi:GNAT superfamily N-acetyltransferase